MAQWEYLRVIVDQKDNVNTPDGPHNMYDVLEELGGKGWELVSTDVVGPSPVGVYVHVLWFKREY